MIGGLVMYAVLVVGSAGLLVSGLSTVRAGFDRYAERTVITDRPRSSLESIALGTTAMVGTARPDGEPERVPFGGQERALVYEVCVDDTNTRGSPHVDERIGSPFVLEPDSGDGTNAVTDSGEDGTVATTDIAAGTDDARIRVDPSNLRFDLSADRQWERTIASHDPIPDDLAAFAEENDLPRQGLERDREFAYRYLAPGDEVFVYGRAVPDDDVESAATKRVLITAREGGDGFLSDKPPETLLEERRRARLRHVSIGTVKAVVGLVAVLWLTGIAPMLL